MILMKLRKTFSSFSAFYYYQQFPNLLSLIAGIQIGS